MIHLENISKSYAGRQVLTPLNLEINRGEIVALIGPSGCGKSTLLRIIMGLIQSDSGSVHIHGTRMESESVLAIRREIGFVIQDGGLFPHLTARDNVTLMADYLGMDPQKITHRLEELRTLTDFPKDGLQRFPVELSGGQRQRVSLMRALMLDPQILLLDEPLGALDPLIRADLQQDMRSIIAELDKTVVLVTHDMAEAAYFGERILMMREGEIIQDGKLQELAQTPASPFVTRFINAQRDPWRNLEDSIT
jgi:osmoprotectant transport system ATP-binding protein